MFDSPPASLLARKPPEAIRPHLSLVDSSPDLKANNHSDSRSEDQIIALLDKNKNRMDYRNSSAQQQQQQQGQAFRPTTYSKIAYCPPRRDSISAVPPWQRGPPQPAYSSFPATPGVSEPPVYPFAALSNAAAAASAAANDIRPEETSLPIPTSSSIFLHKGFFDLAGLVNRYPPASSPALGKDGGYAVAAARSPPPAHAPWASSPAPQDFNRLGPRSVGQYPRAVSSNNYKRISTDMISAPTGFAHLCHASDAEQASLLLHRWQTDGLGKLAEPAWVIPIKEAARAKARAAGVAQVQAHLDSAKQTTLKVVNPSDSVLTQQTEPTESILSNVAVNGDHDAPPRAVPARAPSVRNRRNTNDTIIIYEEPRKVEGVPVSNRHTWVEDDDDAVAAAAEYMPFKPSLETLEKSTAAAIYFEQFYHGILKRPKARDQRRRQFEAALLRLSDDEKMQARAAFNQAETEYLRDLRTRIQVGSFSKLKVVGHGAFGVVNLVKEKSTGQLYAMKQLRKADMLRKGQEGHVRAERDIMTQASETSRWIVRLVYSFQDLDHLYLVMEWMSGGDLLNLLIERDVFDENFARFYVAEMCSCIQEAHQMGFIHRDIKPDNFLFDSSGHLKLSDFGLATDFHWAHDGAYYDQQRRALLKKHGIDLEDGDPYAGTVRRRDHYDFEGFPGALDESTNAKTVFTWRDKNRKKLAYSVVGTNNYMAPEVIRGQGYSESCDWWSAGVITFEMLFGFPAFVSKTRHMTRQKILNWRSSLKFPANPPVSRDAKDFIEKLLCEREDRLGSEAAASVSRPNSQITSQRRPTISGPQFRGGGLEQIKLHPWFRGMDFSTLHLQTPPFVPDLKDAADTRYFEEDIDPNPLAPPHGENPEATKDPLLRDRVHGQHLLQVRKSLAFVGYTYKKPKKQVYDPRKGTIQVLFENEDTRGRTLNRSPQGSSAIRSLSL